MGMLCSIVRLTTVITIVILYCFYPLLCLTMFSMGFCSALWETMFEKVSGDTIEFLGSLKSINFPEDPITMYAINYEVDYHNMKEIHVSV